MLYKVAFECTNYLISKEIISISQRSIYIYGFELLFSFLTCLLNMLFWGKVLGCLTDLFIFLYFFIPIRIVAGGYHAKTFHGCFLLTNMISFSCIFFSRILWGISLINAKYILLGIFLISYVYISFNISISSIHNHLTSTLIYRNQKFSYIIMFLNTTTILYLLYKNTHLYYLACITSTVVAYMLKIFKKGMVLK